jgi:uncharacterized membrane protein
VILDLSCTFSVQLSLPYSKVGIASVLYIHNLVCFWTLEGCRSRLMILVICKNFDNFFGISFSFFI